MTFEEWHKKTFSGDMSPETYESLISSGSITYKAMKRAYEAGYKEGFIRGRFEGSPC